MYQGDIMGKKLSAVKRNNFAFSLLLHLSVSLTASMPSSSSRLIIPFPAAGFLSASFPRTVACNARRATDIPLFGHRSAIIRDCTHIPVHSERLRGTREKGIVRRHLIVREEERTAYRKDRYS